MIVSIVPHCLPVDNSSLITYYMYACVFKHLVCAPVCAHVGMYLQAIIQYSICTGHGANS